MTRIKLRHLKKETTLACLAFSITGGKKNKKPHSFVFAEEPATLRSGEGDGFGGQGGRVNVAAHQNVHFFLCLHLRLLKYKPGAQDGVRSARQTATEKVNRVIMLTSWCIRWYTFCSLSSTTKDSDGLASPLKIKLRSPRWHFMSVKSMRVVSNLRGETKTQFSTFCI